MAVGGIRRRLDCGSHRGDPARLSGEHNLPRSLGISSHKGKAMRARYFLNIAVIAGLVAGMVVGSMMAATWEELRV